MIRTVFCTLLPALLLAACVVTGSPGVSTQVRVANHSTRDFDRVLVHFPEQQEDYGRLASGAASEYRTVREAYRYAYIEVHMGTSRLVLQPIDYVGESLLGPGRFTYALSLSSSGQNLVLELQRN